MGTNPRNLRATEPFESLDGPAESGVEEAWQVEIERRVREIERGEVELIPGAEVFERLRRQLG